MCGVGVAMGMQMLGNYNSKRAQQKQLEAQYRNMAQQYTQQAQNARNMATVNRNNANIVRFNEQERGRQGAYEQSNIRKRGEQALSQINVASASNNIGGMSVGNIYAQSAGETARDLNASRYNTALDMYGQEIQASNYVNQAGAYDTMAGYYDDMTNYFNQLASNVGSTPAWKTFLSGIPSALQTYFNWSNITSGSGASSVQGETTVSEQASMYPSSIEDTRLWGSDVKDVSGYTGGSTYDMTSNAINYYTGVDNRNHSSYQDYRPATAYYGNIGDTSYWTSPNSTVGIINTLNGRSVPLGITIP